MARIIVVGAGIGGISQLRKELASQHRFVPIGDSHWFEFTPSNSWVGLPRIPARNTNWASRGQWVHLAKIAYEKYFLHKVRATKTEPIYEKTIMKMIGVERLKESN